MCGISGVVNCGDRETLARMTHVQAHRGPDDSGLWDRKFPDGSYIGLGSRRLAILDLSPVGHMPMCNEDRTVWITYNGEIYNFAELRQELESKGHRFASHTDTEVIIHLYEEEGPDCVKRLNGMFAFAICDLRSATPTLFVARDHFGVKPFYYFHDGQRFAFASEIKALLQIPEIEAELDPASLHQYLTFLWVPDPKTMFRRILKLPAGHYATLRKGELKLTQYWDLTFPAAHQTYTRSEDDLAEEVRERFRRSVEAQMVSDVPIGAFLSAGLDSSGIVAMMCRATNQPIRTYTITFPPKYRVGETTLDDPEVATRLARHLGCENHRIVVEPDVTDLLPRLIWHMDEPTADPAIITAYLVCREARKQATVLLSGVGGDELFAGYRKHVGALLGAGLRARSIGCAPLGRGRSGRAAQPARYHAEGTTPPGEENGRAAPRSIRSTASSRTARISMRTRSPDSTVRAMMAEVSAIRSCWPAPCRVRPRAATPTSCTRCCISTRKIFMASLNLTYNDKMSMASSVEVRVPFLDRELAEFVAWNIPPEHEAEGVPPADDEIHLPQSDARHFAARSVAATKGWLRGSGRLLVGPRSQRNGG